MVEAAPTVLQAGKVLLEAIKAGGLISITQAQAQEAARKAQVKRAEDLKDEEDDKHVVKVGDAVYCVRRKLESAELIEEIIATVIIGMFSNGAAVSTRLNKIAQHIVDCIRKAQLSQSKPKQISKLNRKWSRRVKGDHRKTPRVRR